MFKITQGTTPTHSFTLPAELSASIQVVRFVYSQDEEVKIIKAGDDVKRAAAKVSTTLTQEDTYLLTPGVPVELVLRVLTLGGDALMSEEVKGRCRGCADKEVLV